MSLGNPILQMQRGSDCVQGQISELTGIKVGHLSKLEQDEGDPKMSTLHKLTPGAGTGKGPKRTDF